MKIISRRFSREHIETRVDWINCESIHVNMFFDLPISVGSTIAWYENNLNSKTRLDFTFLDEANAIVGMGGFTNMTEINRNAEFYIMVNPELLGRGFGKVISRWMYNYAFSVLNLNKVYLYTNDDNIAAYTMYEKAGFILEGILREHKAKNGRFIDKRIYGLLRKEWEAAAWKEYLQDEI